MASKKIDISTIFRGMPTPLTDRFQLSLIVQGIERKYIERKRKTQPFKIERRDVLDDIQEYFEAQVLEISDTQNVSSYQNKVNFTKNEIINAYKLLKINPEIPDTPHYVNLDISAYNALIADAKMISTRKKQKVQTRCRRIYTEFFCVYAFDKSYIEFVSDAPRMYEENGQIKLIQSNLHIGFCDFLNSLLSAIENFNHGNSPTLIKVLLDLLSRDTKTIVDALNNGGFYREASEYLYELYRLMDKASSGFGVNINEFNKIWDCQIGIDILNLNKEQKVGRKNSDGVDIKAFSYKRIFLMTALDIDDLVNTSEEQATIIKQLDSWVDVYCIFQEDWKCCGNHNDFDYAVLKVDNCSVLMSTIFDKSDSAIKNGFFITDAEKVTNYYSETLGLLLEFKGLKIYKPILNKKKKLIFGNCLDNSDVNELNEKLKAIVGIK